MNILLLTVGSRGDIQPFVALGHGLRAAGHQVTVAAPALFENFVREYGLRFAPLNDDLLKLKDTAAGKDALEGKGNKLALMKQVKPMLGRLMQDEWKAAQDGPDLIVYHPKTLVGLHIAEKLGVPAIMSIPLPLMTPTSAFPIPLITASLGGWFNRLTYLANSLIYMPYNGMINAWRQETLGLPKRPRGLDELTHSDGSPVPVLYSYSQRIVPRPADWLAHVQATGYWFLPPQNTYTPPLALQRFLENGKPPIYIGFGSMTGNDPQGKARKVIEALSQAGQRGLIASGWGGLHASDVPDHCFMIEEAPHDWLFEHVTAAVHHGGAGTTAAALRAGKPQLICPFMGDQGFWGQRVYQAGVGAKPIPQGHLSVERLTAAFTSIATDADMQHRATHMGEAIRAEDGVKTAVALIERLALSTSTPMPVH
ncbi:MAG: glycosyltransferase family 1 protein [Anaerolineae bacterium]|nr:glycosyltransferase family 1 protein [Anaerolineae bacterium]